ncbi:UDP-N-acetylmuramate dehydrogenase [Vibrio clamense]|uniref:UDP-N-acetylmuramate dehydrogenase n=1 Tax=Vibrio clamense TaxID=2910254 RepID=UPI003D23F410
MQSYPDVNLEKYHTFGIKQKARFLVEVTSIKQLIDVFQNPEWEALPKLVLGKGSNVLFTDYFDGVVIVNRILGRDISRDENDLYLHVGAGEDWPTLVKWTIEQSIGGLENLALIPGCAGSAPVQNIGAYGIELKDVCTYVDVLCLDTFKIKRLTNEECKFGYRESIFKHELYQKAVVVALGICLSKRWVPNNQYGPLQKIPVDELSPKAIFDEVCRVRMEKLPNPALQGNAGSFFKNPVISREKYEGLLSQFPLLVAYPFDNQFKVAAGWLIDQCAFKGVVCGGAQVHPKQALVLVNSDNASADDIVKLAANIYQTVKDTFGIELEHEVRFIGRQREVTLTEIASIHT